MSVDILGTSWDQCRSMVQYTFTSTETRRLVRTDSPGRPPRLSHSSWTMGHTKVLSLLLLSFVVFCVCGVWYFTLFVVPTIIVVCCLCLRCLIFYILRRAYNYCLDWLIDDHLYSAILRSLEQTHCARLWFYMSDKLCIARFFEYPPKWCTYSAGRAGATWNCSRLGASSVYTIQPCTMSLHAKPHT